MLVMGTLGSAMLHLLRWASTSYCSSKIRKYLALSIIMSWASDGAAITQCILHALPSLDNLLDVNNTIIGSIVAELARLDVVDTAFVLRWIITTGGVSMSTGKVCISDPRLCIY
jgi:hypothetical protein